MSLTFQMVASEILMCGLKKVPVAGTALEIVDGIRNKHEQARQSERLTSIESQLSRFEMRQRDLVAEEIRQSSPRYPSPA